MDKAQVREGMTVRSIRGEFVGTVVACETDEFIVEVGGSRPRDCPCPYGEIDAIHKDEVILESSPEDLLVHAPFHLPTHVPTSPVPKHAAHSRHIVPENEMWDPINPPIGTTGMSSSGSGMTTSGTGFDIPAPGTEMGPAETERQIKKLRHEKKE